MVAVVADLWDLELEVPGESCYRAHVGLREVRADGTDLMLNGKAIKLRGASFHEDSFGRGDGLPPPIRTASSQS